MTDAVDQADDAQEVSLDALRAERQARREATAQAQQAQHELDTLNHRLAAARESARREVYAEQRPKLLETDFRAAVRQLAAGRFRDPEDAVGMLRHRLGEFSDGGDGFRDHAVARAVDELLSAKPYLAADSPRRQRHRRGAR